MGVVSLITPCSKQVDDDAVHQPRRTDAFLVDGSVDVVTRQEDMMEDKSNSDGFL